MALIETVLNRVPEPLRSYLIKHRELLKFAAVGAMTFVVTTVVYYPLKFTFLNDKPITALAFAIVVATVVSYILNREWSFRTRGGRERHHEAALFFFFSACAVAINLIPPTISRYVLLLEVPHVTLLVQETADFISGMIIGTLAGSFFRLWAFKKWVFPKAGARPRVVRGLRRGDRDSDERAA